MKFGPEVVLNEPAYIHPSALLYGKIRIEKGASIWCNVVGRAESQEIIVGPRTNIQDFVMMHVGDSTPTIIGANCSITHHVTVHGCQIGDNCLIGINATVADGAVVGANSIIGQHTFVREGQVIPENSVAVGVPAKVIKTVDNSVRTKLNAYLYYRNALAYARGEYREWSNPEALKEVSAELARLTAEFKELTRA